MSDDYISREAALAALHNRAFDKADTGGEYRALVWASSQIKSLPAADVRPVVRGKWIIHKPFYSGRHNCNECIECSVCGTWFGHDCYEISNFCPHCGADMREEDNNG